MKNKRENEPAWRQTDLSSIILASSWAWSFRSKLSLKQIWHRFNKWFIPIFDFSKIDKKRIFFSFRRSDSVSRKEKIIRIIGWCPVETRTTPGLKDLWQYVSRIFVLSFNELWQPCRNCCRSWCDRSKQESIRNYWRVKFSFLFCLTDRFPCEPKQSPPSCQWCWWLRLKLAPVPLREGRTNDRKKSFAILSNKMVSYHSFCTIRNHTKFTTLLKDLSPCTWSYFDHWLNYH